MAKGIKKQYELLRKKHKLPPFSELDSDFEIAKIESDGSLIREIRKRMIEKIHEIGSIVEQVLQPESNLADLYECRVFDEAEKKIIFEIYKKLMAAIRKSSELAIESNDALEAEFVNSFHKEWEALKPQLLKFIRKLRESWQSDTDESEAAGYMG